MSIPVNTVGNLMGLGSNPFRILPGEIVEMIGDEVLKSTSQDELFSIAQSISSIHLSLHDMLSIPEKRKQNVRSIVRAHLRALELGTVRLHDFTVSIERAKKWLTQGQDLRNLKLGGFPWRTDDITRIVSHQPTARVIEIDSPLLSTSLIEKFLQNSTRKWDTVALTIHQILSGKIIKLLAKIPTRHLVLNIQVSDETPNRLLNLENCSINRLRYSQTKEEGSFPLTKALKKFYVRKLDLDTPHPENYLQEFAANAKELSHLERLRITNGSKLRDEDLKAISQLPLTHLSLAEEGNITANMLDLLPSTITSLSLEGCDKMDMDEFVEKLSRFTHLKKLCLSSFSSSLNDRHLSKLGSLPLESLSLLNCNGLGEEGFKALFHLDLKTLVLHNCNNIKDFSFLSKLAHLNHLEVNSPSCEAKILRTLLHCISECNLRTLAISGIPLSRKWFTSFKQLHNLKSLSLNNCTGITRYNLESFVENGKRLTKLSLRNSDFNNSAALALKNSYIQILDVSFTSLSSLTFLQDCNFQIIHIDPDLDLKDQTNIAVLQAIKEFRLALQKETRYYFASTKERAEGNLQKVD